MYSFGAITRRLTPEHHRLVRMIAEREGVDWVEAYVPREGGLIYQAWFQVDGLSPHQCHQKCKSVMRALQRAGVNYFPSDEAKQGAVK
jgi:hypothetical protein